MEFLSRLTPIKMDLKNLIYISYLVPLRRIRPFVPSVLPISFNEEEQAYVSFVAMKCHRVHLRGICWPHFSYDQLNLRTYVSDPKTGSPAVYFFHSGVSIGILPLITRLLGIPWEKISFALNISSGPLYRASGHWLGEIDFEIESREDKAVQESIVHHLTGPMMGFIGDKEKLRRFKISHRSLEVQEGVLNKIRFPLPVERGLIMENELQEPAIVLIVPKTEFTVYLPPHRVKERN